MLEQDAFLFSTGVSCDYCEVHCYVTLTFLTSFVQNGGEFEDRKSSDEQNKD